MPVRQPVREAKRRADRGYDGYYHLSVTMHMWNATDATQRVVLAKGTV